MFATVGAVAPAVNPKSVAVWFAPIVKSSLALCGAYVSSISFVIVDAASKFGIAAAVISLMISPSGKFVVLKLIEVPLMINGSAVVLVGLATVPVTTV